MQQTQTLPILIINLDRSTDRLAFQQKQFDRLGLRFERVPAVDGTKLPQEIYQRYAFRWERPISETEVACLLSHAACWERAAQGNGAVILEDDQVLADELKPLLAKSDSMSGATIYNLETQPRLKYLSRSPSETIAGIHFHDLFIATAGAGAYLVTKEAAKILVDRLQRHAAIADFFIHSLPGVRHLQSDPGLSVELSILSRFYGQIKRPESATVILREGRNSDLSQRLFWALRHPMMRVRRGLSQLWLIARKALMPLISKRRMVEPSASIFANYNIMNAADDKMRTSHG